MKKLFLLLTSVLLIGLTACGNQEPEYSLEFIEGKTVTIEDNEYVGAFFNFTNNGDETVMPADAIDVKAFQNGTELNIVVYTGKEVEGAIQCDTSVQSGTTAEVVWTFETQDDSTVSLECGDGQKMTFEIQ
jgi:ABC-type glycerol-3-phosphate transport system substrate-binding protein